MKIGLLQCNSITGDFAGNAARIADAARRAAELGAELCVTPEMALCGAAPRGLARLPGFGRASRETLRELARELADCPPVIVGASLPNLGGEDKPAVNAAVLLSNGEFSMLTRKVFQPHSFGSDEGRYFAGGMTCGIMTLNGWRFGIVLCEDGFDEYSFWQIRRGGAHVPLIDLISRGVDAIIQLAASSFYAGGQVVRENMLSHVAARHHIHLFSVNLAGGNDGLVFNGQSLAFSPGGAMLARGLPFAEDVCVIDAASRDSGRVSPAIASEEEEIWQALVLGLRDYTHKSGFSRALIGLSGGLDSAMVAAVAVEALGAENVHGLLLPSPYTSRESIDYALALAANLGMGTDTVPLQPMMKAYEEGLAPIFAQKPPLPGDVTMENIQARIRGNILMALANRENMLVLNTGNKSEAAAGYCTLYGDGVGALAVIGDVPKTMVSRISVWLNGQKGREVIPDAIIKRPPTAELRENQLDSDSLPPYPELDAALARVMVRGKRAGEKDEGRDASGREATEQRVIKLMLGSEYKRRQTPPALRVSSRAFGYDFTLPVVSRFR